MLAVARTTNAVTFQMLMKFSVIWLFLFSGQYFCRPLLKLLEYKPFSAFLI